MDINSQQQQQQCTLLSFFRPAVKRKACCERKEIEKEEEEEELPIRVVKKLKVSQTASLTESENSFSIESEDKENIVPSVAVANGCDYDFEVEEDLLNFNVDIENDTEDEIDKMSNNDHQWFYNPSLSESRIIEKDHLFTDNNIRSFKRPSLQEEEDFPSLNNIELEQELSKRFSRIPRATQFWNRFIEAYYNFRRIYNFPYWIDPEEMKDQNGESPGSLNFDFTKISIPPNMAKMKPVDGKVHRMHLTPAMLQYWNLKKDHFDKILLFKLGKFYEIFYTDACIVQQLCNLNWMGNDEKAHVGFPESSLHSYGEQLVASGLKVTVVEQMETPQELAIRMQSASTPIAKTVNRQVCEVYSAGTVTHPEMLKDFETKWLLAISFDKKKEGGFCAADLSTNLILYGEVVEKDLRRILLYFNPSEILLFEVSGKEEKGEEWYKQLSACETKLTFVKQRFDLLLKFSDEDFIKVLESKVNIRMAVELLLSYLENACLSERLLKLGRFEEFQENGNSSEFMYMDPTAWTSLQILPEDGGGDTGTSSLFDLLNCCKTAQGGRTLKAWLKAPLKDLKKINRRLDAVEWLIENNATCVAIRNLLSKIPDLERQLGRASALALRSARGAVYFSSSTASLIGNFLKLLDAFERLLEIKGFLSDWESIAESSPPEPLLEFICESDASSLKSLIREFRLKFSENAPAPGACEDYDALGLVIKSKEQEINQYVESGELAEALDLNQPSLLAQAQIVNCKFRYEIEVSDKAWATIVKSSKNSEATEVQLTSSKAGVKRFHTAFIKEAISEIEKLESDRESAVYPFMAAVFLELQSHSFLLKRSASAVAALDVLCSFAHWSATWPFADQTTRPQFLDLENHPPQLLLDDSTHPIVAKRVSNFTTNSVKFHHDTIRSILITGPNMGGKSTFSKQVALNVIMAQTGCFVPSGKLVLTPVDKIFTRIGAWDSLLEGKSTFYIELTDMAHCLNYGTSHSLFICDEFGRGTSVEDGQALALATLSYLTNRVKGLVLFSTHFHEITNRLMASLPHCGFYHMAASTSSSHLISNSSCISFLYKLTEGLCSDSHGLEVAALAGLDPQLVNWAKEKMEMRRKKTIDLGIDGAEALLR